MSYRLLSREEMVSVSAPLVDEAHPDCQAIKSYPLSRALWDLVLQAHTQLLQTQRVSPTAERLAEISNQLAETGARHDDVLRGIYHGLEAQEYLAKDATIKAQVRRLRDKIFPEQLMAIRKSYRGQAGQAVLLQSRLSAEDFGVLRRLVTLDGRSLADAVTEWILLAKIIGALENERSGYDDNAPRPADVVAARNGWIRAIQAFFAPLRLRDDVPEAVIAILDRIEMVVEGIARRRGQAQDTDGQESSPDSGAEPVSADDAAPAGSAGEAADEMIAESTTRHELRDVAHGTGQGASARGAMTSEQIAR